MDSLASKLFEQTLTRTYREQGPQIEFVINTRAALGNLQSGGTIKAVQDIRQETATKAVHGLLDAYETMCKETDRKLDQALIAEIQEQIAIAVKSQLNAVIQDMLQTCKRVNVGNNMDVAIRQSADQFFSGLSSDVARRLEIWQEKEKRRRSNPVATPSIPTLRSDYLLALGALALGATQLFFKPTLPWTICILAIIAIALSAIAIHLRQYLCNRFEYGKWVSVILLTVVLVIVLSFGYEEWPIPKITELRPALPTANDLRKIPTSPFEQPDMRTASLNAKTIPKPIEKSNNIISNSEFSQRETSRKRKVREDLTSYVEQLWTLERQARQGQEGPTWSNTYTTLQTSIINYLKTNLDSSYVEQFNHPNADNLKPREPKRFSPQDNPYQGQWESETIRAQIRYLRVVINEQK